jgi:hypothetical protein
MVAQETLNLLVRVRNLPLDQCSTWNGILAHLVERYHDTVEVAGSIPAGPTRRRGVRGPHTTID